MRYVERTNFIFFLFYLAGAFVMSEVGVSMLLFSVSFVEVLECFINLASIQIESNIKLMHLTDVERKV